MGELHGYGIVLHIQKGSDALLCVEEGSLYPGLHRMEWMDLLGMEADRDQSRGKVLPAYDHRPQGAAQS